MAKMAPPTPSGRARMRCVRRLGTVRAQWLGREQTVYRNCVTLWSAGVAKLGDAADLKSATSQDV